MKLMMELEMKFDMDDGSFLISVIRSDIRYGGIVDDESREDGVDGNNDEDVKDGLGE